MKIAILNLPVDNNYGGNLQRYALVKVLQGMGYDVKHINLRFNIVVKWKPLVITAIKRTIKSIIHQKRYEIFPTWNAYKRYKKKTALTDVFYKRYVPHTKIYRTKEELSHISGYDAYLVGSDQVWRKFIAKPHGIDTYFFEFLQDANAKRIAYGASLGTAENELNNEEIVQLGFLYKKFDAVSVREDSGLKLLKEYGWNRPEPQVVLDPTLLLDMQDYNSLIEESETYSPEGSLFAYILDYTEEKEQFINDISHKYSFKSFSMSLSSNKNTSVEQWLRFFKEAKMVITDSFHGLLFSIIYNKPYFLIKNEFRGNARFDSILSLFHLSENELQRVDWTEINHIKDYMKRKSMMFLEQSLNRN